MKRFTTVLFILLFVIFNHSDVSGEIKLPSVISEGVVFQRNEPITIWGCGTPGEEIVVSLNDASAKTVTDENGNWEVVLSPQKPGGPYKLTVNTIVIDDVAIGDLYFCSGQSNMELPMNRVTDLFENELKTYSNPMIREFKTPKEYAFDGPKDDTSSSVWKKAEGEDSNKFGALVWFMARYLYENNGHVPVGIVNSSWGGSRIRAWISETSLNDYPGLMNLLSIYENDDYRKMISEQESFSTYLWKKTMDREDTGLNPLSRWEKENLDDSDWEKVILPQGKWGERKGLPINGSHWFRKKFILSEDQSQNEGLLRLGCIVDADSVWVNGNFVGFTAYQYPPRKYRIPSEFLKEGENVITIRVVSNAGIPHFVEEKPYKIIFSDGGEIDLKGEWRHKIGAEMPEAPGVTDFFQQPTVLYNSMVNPFRKLPFRGVVWYQGESDVDNHSVYDEYLITMINDWRNAFANGTLPFYIVELADFLHPEDIQGRNEWQHLREAQLRASEGVENCKLIKNSDTGEWNDIHPLDKKTPGERIAKEILKK